MPSLNKSHKELIAYLFEGKPNAIKTELSSWVAGSPRYATFIEEYRDKIRKKIRVASDRDALEDVVQELQVAHWLLGERRFEVAYEPHAAGNTRSPDYAVTYRKNFRFNMEVTHVRGLAGLAHETAQDEAGINSRLVDVLCSKLRQMLPSTANLIFIVAAPPGPPKDLDLPAHAAWIKAQAEAKDPSFYKRHRFADTSEFFRYFERLTGIILLGSGEAPKHVLWLNPQGKFGLPKGVANILGSGLAP